MSPDQNWKGARAPLPPLQRTAYADCISASCVKTLKISLVGVRAGIQSCEYCLLMNYCNLLCRQHSRKALDILKQLYEFYCLVLKNGLYFKI